MFFLLCISVTKYLRRFSHSSGVMVNITFPVMDEVIRVRAMPEFVHQNCVKLIGNGGARPD